MEDQNTQHSWQPPSLADITRVVQRLDESRDLHESLSTPQAGDFALRSATCEALIVVADALTRLVQLQTPAAAPPVPQPVAQAAINLGALCAGIEVKQRSVQDVASDGFEHGKRVDALAVLNAAQVAGLVEGVEVIGGWISEQMAAHLEATVPGFEYKPPTFSDGGQQA